MKIIDGKIVSQSIKDTLKIKVDDIKKMEKYYHF